MRALYTAATGMAAQELNVQVISNNIANMRTTGYKKQRAAFQDLIYDHVRRVGAQASEFQPTIREALKLLDDLQAAGGLRPPEGLRERLIKGSSDQLWRP